MSSQAGRLARKPPRREDPLSIVPAVDGFRGLAVLLVVLFHVWRASGYPALDGGLLRDLVGRQGFPALTYLFVISGFVMFLPVARNHGRFGRVSAYAIRRVARVVPAYYLSLLGLALLWPVLTVAQGSFWTWSRIEALLLHMSFLHWEVLGGIQGFFGLDEQIGFGVNGPLWTMSLEAIFYAVLPLVAGIYFRRPFLGLALALAVQTAWRASGIHFLSVLTQAGLDLPDARGIASFVNLQFPGIAANLALGMTAAWVYVAVLRSPSRSPLARARRFAPLVALVAAGVLVALVAHGGHYSADPRVPFASGGAYFNYVGDPLLAACFALAMLATAVSSKRAQVLATNPVSGWLGRVSYGAYLWHVLVIAFAIQQIGWRPDGSNGTFLRFLGFGVPLSFACGWLSYRLVEQPIIRAAKNWLARRRAVAPPPAPQPDKRTGGVVEPG